MSTLNGLHETTLETVCAKEVESGSNRTCSSLNKAVKDLGARGIMFETRNCFEDEKGIRHYLLFATSFFDSVDGYAVPRFDFERINRPKAEYGA